MSLAGFAVNAKPCDSGLTRCFNVSFLGFVVGFQCDPPKFAQTASLQHGEMVMGRGSHLSCCSDEEFKVRQ